MTSSTLRYLLTVFALLIPLQALGAESHPTSPWLEDLSFLGEQLPRRHVDPFRQISRADWDRRIQQLRTELPALSDEQAVLEFSRLVATIGDGHTEMIPFQLGAGFHRLPLVFSHFADETRVIAVAPGHEDLLGAVVTKIGGESISALRAALKPFVARDNDRELLHSGPEYLATPEVLRALGAKVDQEDVSVSLVLPNGESKTTRVRAYSRDGAEPIRWKTARDHAGVDPPLYAQSPARDYWVKQPSASPLLFVKYNRCDDQDGEPSIRRFSKDLLKRAKASDVQAIVLDMRHNAGGNNHKSSPLIDALRRWKAGGQGRVVYVLVGQMTFSAAMDTAIRLEHEVDVVFVGSPPRGRPNTVGDVESMILPRSGLRVDYSTAKYHRMPHLGDAEYLPLDITVQSTWDDYVTGRDPALLAVLERVS